TIKIDKTMPAIVCASPDGLWHAADVSLACSSNDGGSGLSNAADASFTLSTSVPAGTEDANASTGSRTVCDRAGNCAAAGPIVGHAVGVTRLSDNTSLDVVEAGNANPDFDFHYDPSLGGYLFHLKTTGYGAGTYALNFVAGGDTTIHWTQFKIK